MKRKSIITKLCLLLITIIIVISIVIGTWSIKDTNKIVQAEIGKLNSEVLDEVSDNISIFLSKYVFASDNSLFNSNRRYRE